MSPNNLKYFRKFGDMSANKTLRSVTISLYRLWALVIGNGSTDDAPMTNHRTTGQQAPVQWYLRRLVLNGKGPNKKY
jgi:hypothetical protein